MFHSYPLQTAGRLGTKNQLQKVHAPKPQQAENWGKQPSNWDSRSQAPSAPTGSLTIRLSRGLLGSTFPLMDTVHQHHTLKNSPKISKTVGSQEGPARPWNALEQLSLGSNIHFL